MLTHIHHINFLVADLKKSVVYFQKLLSHQPITEILHERQVETARFNIGESLLILVQPLSDKGVVAEILADKGEGIFLISFATQSIDESLYDLEQSYSARRKGLNGWSICDIAPLEQFGVILQQAEC